MLDQTSITFFLALRPLPLPLPLFRLDGRKATWRLSKVMLMEEATTKMWVFPASCLLTADRGGAELFSDSRPTYANRLMEEIWQVGPAVDLVSP
eukprot:SAG11_NODE_7356_length_1156_cov_1.663198_2_plen_94_part_00